jgi:hypothetical protein
VRVCQFRHTGFWGPSYSGKFLNRQTKMLEVGPPSLAAWYKRNSRLKIDLTGSFHGVAG